MADAVVDRLPTVEEIESALAENRQNGLLLRSIRLALKRRKLQQYVSRELREQRDTARQSEVPRD